MANDEKDGIDRRGALECMIWAGNGRAVDDGCRRAAVVLAARDFRGKRAGGERLQLPADFRQPRRIQAGGKPEPSRNAGGSNRQSRCFAPEAGVHDPHRRHYSPVEGPRNSTTPIRSSARRSSILSMSPANTTSSMKVKARPIWSVTAKRTQAKGTGWYSFDRNGVHFVGLVNVANLKAGGMGSLGAEQLAWLADDLKGKSSSTPIVLFAHIPFWTVSAEWGWGTDDSAQALGLVKRFGSVTVLNGHIHQIMQKVEGTVTFHTARSTAFPQPAPGTAPSPGPDEGAGGQAAQCARHYLGRGKARHRAARRHRQRPREGLKHSRPPARRQAEAGAADAIVCASIRAPRSSKGIPSCRF